MGILSGIHDQCIGHDVRQELLPDLVLRPNRLQVLVLHKSSESLVQPETGPPFHSDEIAEPHMRDLMADCAAVSRG